MNYTIAKKKKKVLRDFSFKHNRTTVPDVVIKYYRYYSYSFTAQLFDINMNLSFLLFTVSITVFVVRER